MYAMASNLKTLHTYCQPEISHLQSKPKSDPYHLYPGLGLKSTMAVKAGIFFLLNFKSILECVQLAFMTIYVSV